MVLVSESRTTTDIEGVEIRIEGYNIVRCDSCSRHTGGTCTSIYIRGDLNFMVNKPFILEGNYWCRFIKVETGSSSCVVGCLYHSPSGSYSIFIDNFEDICYFMCTCNMNCILVGDFNLHYLDKTLYSNRIKNVCNVFGISQLVKVPTRVTAECESLVDYVLLSCNWSFNTTDVNILYNEILNTCDEVINAAAPTQYCKYRNDIPWFDSELHYKIKIRDASYKDFKASSGNEKHKKWEIFKKHRNDVVNSLKVKKKQIL
nr:unnamed protein product [Callosobruchus analis]